MEIVVIATLVMFGLMLYRDTDALVTPPFIVEARGGGSTVRPIDHPLATIKG